MTDRVHFDVAEPVQPGNWRQHWCGFYGHDIEQAQDGKFIYERCRRCSQVTRAYWTVGHVSEPAPRLDD